MADNEREHLIGVELALPTRLNRTRPFTEERKAALDVAVITFTERLRTEDNLSVGIAKVVNARWVDFLMGTGQSYAEAARQATAHADGLEQHLRFAQPHTLIPDLLDYYAAEQFIDDLMSAAAEAVPVSEDHTTPSASSGPRMRIATPPGGFDG